MNRVSLSLALSLVTTAFATAGVLDYVDPRIGTGDHGHVFFGASVPYGMVQLGPTSVMQGWDWTSGYHDSDSTVLGFSHTHLSGTGVGDLYDITLMPVTGDVIYERGDASKPGSGPWSYSRRSSEKCLPGYYETYLPRYDIGVQLTATKRAGFHKYLFLASDSAGIIIDLANGGNFDRPQEVEIKVLGKNKVGGYRNSTGWANAQRVYFVAEFSEPFDSLTLHGEGNRYGRLHFPKSSSPKEILVKVGISGVSVDGAQNNLSTEIPDWDFEKVRTAASDQWERELSRIAITTDHNSEKRKFYTSLYHTMISPATFNDVDGAFRGADGKCHPGSGYDNYTVLSLWDTYRAAMPLMSIIDPHRYGQLVQSMLDIHDQQGRLPVWHLWGCETDCMVGNPGAIAVADAVTKRTPGVDYERALKACIETQNDTIRGLNFRKQYGFIPCDFVNEGIAKSMEYDIADAAIANAAASLGKAQIAQDFTTRSHSYRNYWDGNIRFLRGRMSDDSWRTPFDPHHSTHNQDDYCEGTAWQYLWLVPHDIQGMAKLMGGTKPTLERLDSLFMASTELNGDPSPDISGLIGQYAHGNEPSHHVAYLYSMLGKPEKTEALVTDIMDNLYHDGPAGLCGNEDAGQMSAWYILSSLGFYPVEPASGKYQIGTPRYEKAVVEIPGGVLTILAPNASKGWHHVKKVKLNGKTYKKSYLLHSDLMTPGTVIEFELSAN